jgi:hypothetical protein
MPGKSKSKQLRYATKKQTVTAQDPAPVVAGAAVPAPKTATTASRNPVAAKAAAYTPELLAHVGSELKMTLALSASLLVIIVILYFIIH